MAPVEEDEDHKFGVKFEKIVYSKDLQENEIEIQDNLGRLLIFVSHCLVIFEKFEAEYDTREIKRLIKLSLEKVIGKELKFEDLVSGNRQNVFLFARGPISCNGQMCSATPSGNIRGGSE